MHVLVVDDDPDIRLLARFSLERVGGHRVRLAASGREAVDLVAAEAPDIVLLDLRMPGSDGRATLAELRERFGPLPVVFLTAQGPARELDGLDILGVLSKPFDPMELPRQLQELVEAGP